MMDGGRIVLDIGGEERRHMTVPGLLNGSPKTPVTRWTTTVSCSAPKNKRNKSNRGCPKRAAPLVCVCYRVAKIKNRRHRRTCADDGDTYREILPKIVCEEPATSARFWVKFCRRGFQRGENRSVRRRRARLLPLLRVAPASFRSGPSCRRGGTSTARQNRPARPAGRGRRLPAGQNSAVENASPLPPRRGVVSTATLVQYRAGQPVVRSIRWEYRCPS